jgi:hypothetical protein
MTQPLPVPPLRLPPWSSPGSFSVVVDVELDEVVVDVEVVLVVVVGLPVVEVVVGAAVGVSVWVIVVVPPPPHAANPVAAPTPRAIDVAIVASRSIALLSSRRKRGRVARTRAGGWGEGSASRFPAAIPPR